MTDFLTALPALTIVAVISIALGGLLALGVSNSVKWLSEDDDFMKRMDD